MSVGIIYLYEWHVGIMCVGIMYSMPPKTKLVLRGEMSFDILPSPIYYVYSQIRCFELRCDV